MVQGFLEIREEMRNIEQELKKIFNFYRLMVIESLNNEYF